ncbi:hypothetical protein NOR_03183 [Metarhizium rileyi]|uniref:Uncharacterized protein n=1 Tax=Metarhizium rileyi (strain RCEF 4871) TaxID=1649241 RepID=A0A167FK96_METRR|nr:hypothetical protein NOR_03183 [Metarhizium rileyi RCEF 4871]
MRATYLPPPASNNIAERSSMSNHGIETTATESTTIKEHRKLEAAKEKVTRVDRAKTKHKDRLRSVVEEKAIRESAGTRRGAQGPVDVDRALEESKYSLVFEHVTLPFLLEFLPEWAGPYPVIASMQGRTKEHHHRICIMTTDMLSRARKISIALHVTDLLPEKLKSLVSFAFSVV